ncbi:MAG TPA: Gfo/Idh/MocA family oxidoreductase [Clostridia bacterium]|nr:Gfo/Idh/MocA family oxidoreductase [Clostridia bacterium]
MRTFRVGVVGAGTIGVQHIDALRRVPGVQVYAVCDANAQRAEEVRAQWDIPVACDNWKDLIEDPQVEAVHDCTPNALHDAVNRAAILAGKHIYSEKPLSTSAAEALALWRLAVEHGVAHGVNHQYRLNAAVQDMRARVASGDAGRVFMVRGHYLQESNAIPAPGIWRTGALGGVSYALADVGIHWMDTACCVLGKRVEAVCADLQTVHESRTDASGATEAARLEDLASVLVRFEDGTPGVLTASKISLGHKNDLSLSVDAAHYGMRWDQESPDRLWIGHRTHGNEEIYMCSRLAREEAKPYISAPAGHTMGWSDALRNAVAAFYASVRSGDYARQPQPYATFEAGYLGTAFVEACLKSHKERRWISLESEKSLE